MLKIVSFALSVGWHPPRSAGKLYLLERWKRALAEGPSPSLHTPLELHSVTLKHNSQPDTDFLAVSFQVQCSYLKQLKTTILQKILKDAGNPSLGSNNSYCFLLVLLPILSLSQLHHYA